MPANVNMRERLREGDDAGSEDAYQVVDPHRVQPL